MSSKRSFNFRDGSSNRNDSLYYYQNNSMDGLRKPKRASKWLPCVKEQLYRLDEEDEQESCSKYVSNTFDAPAPDHTARTQGALPKPNLHAEKAK